MTWQVLHHIAGFRRLGFDVWYVEDSDISVFSPSTWWPTWDYSETVQFLGSHMDFIGLGDRWVFRPSSVSHSCFGALDVGGLAQLYCEADAVFNLCGSHKPRPDHSSIRCLVYLETDPVMVQIGVAEGDEDLIRYLDSYSHLFTYGENLGAGDCQVPMERFAWHPTRPPVCVDWWKNAGCPKREARLTTVANWDTTGKDVVWNGQIYRWRKDVQFAPFIGLPARSVLPLEMALVGISKEKIASLRKAGWQITSGTELSKPAVYRDYMRNSRGEFTVAKEQVAAPQSGWFSDRSVCYLAAGRPVITQETGFSKFIPAGEGLFSFSTTDEALEAIEAVAGNYERHSKAAGETAREYFAAEKVLGKILATIGLM